MRTMRSLVRRLSSLTPTILRPSDQAVVAGGALLSIVAMGVAWLAAGGAYGRLVEPTGHPRQSATFRLDINAAPAAELDLLPNIGESRAQQIIRERQQGPFTSPEDIGLRIKGIGEKTIAQMKPYLPPIGAPASSEP
jgi:DNA uptake protein ComE-like DNA-binding protein